jgi:CubicO group peptidase (beta-lactamase class C family)
VRTYLPDYDTHGRRVPVLRLLDHTSGIQSYTLLPEFRDVGAKTLPRDTLVKLLARTPFAFEPGTLEMYSNSGFFLLGLIIEKVSGQSYADYVQQHLFDPAGMKDSRYCSDMVVPGMTHGYELDDKGLRHASIINYTWPYAAGSLCSTVADLDAWNRALHGGKILGAAAYREMITPGTLTDGSPLRYAKGIAVSDVGGRRAFHHSGDINGFATYLAYFPEDRLSIAVAINTDGPVRPATIAQAIAGVVHGKPATAAPVAGKMADCVGAYRGPGGMGVDLRVTIAADSAGRLVLRGPIVRSDAPATLAHAGGDTFQLDDKQLTFVREDGHVVKLRVDAVYAYLVLKREQ